MNNSEIISNIANKLDHLEHHKSLQLAQLIREFNDLFPDVPSKTTVVHHDVDIGDATSITQHPYRVNPLRLEAMRTEIKYMLDNGIIEPSNSDFSSPSMLVPKPDGSYRFVANFKAVNAITKSDSYPIPRIEDCIDKIGRARYVSKFDLLKGFWQVPLTERAKRVSAFITPDGLFNYCVMPFGMRNSPATFQRLINQTFCVNFSTFVNPLTNLLGKNIKFVWSDQCNEAFDKVKRLLMTHPVLVTADYDQQFICRR